MFPEKLQELAEIAAPLVKFLNENFNPHTEIRVTDDSVQVVQVEMSHPYSGKFIKD